MLALAFTFAAALVATPSASVTCADGPASCDSSWAAPIAFAAGGERQDGPDDGPPEYATPAEVDCPEPPQPPAVVVLASGDCSQSPPNFWYRVSRYPESELPAGRMAPTSARRARSAKTVTGGLPDAGQLTKSTVQPIALTATTAPFLAVTGRLEATPARDLPSRGLAPPDRPPRA
jgi:hypothetical protein